MRKDMTYDPTLLVGDYVLRAEDASALEGTTEDWHPYAANAWFIRNIDPIKAKKLLESARSFDSKALIFACPRKDV
jgi:hypothetical protein